MHHARLHTSPRLRRALKVLQEARGEITTYELSRAADICAVNSVIAELRENGAEITCRQAIRDGQRLFYYRLKKSPKGC
ncbi:hypothetical protein GTA62_12920 [Roseobacter sp. HKCCD9010]|uniref:helix-turn-helix domain-containing protein n=1 Tax=unclassified Roseobacter TaxID=196798 RepID=UPI0014908FFD|nr:MULTISPECIES: helix-turn-helix domain-containing protein [unclassified Roseobacter]MBF9049914.1 hypothetical protein [Rhodobacterales bacterium HKCCD4356]NNV13547.1 hypothetical protein [Roseobacter sp. HKCCD7357]NNV16381.1 hypothetical protein [Roseobacter sp. HKCCD8768]NNV25840.1 hypothetical protein [Roseobacter sp. HKCCD8192]NNV30098.1 hypothetical protein [Roseobacter sp. HKCCD9061]